MIFERKFFALLGMLWFIASASIAQSYVESALLFGRNVPGGSARIQGMAGSQIALGGDYSSLQSNPAGLGMYNRSEVTLTPGFSSYNTEAQYLGNTDNASKSSVNIPGLSFVFHMPLDKNGFVGGSFGISMSRTNDFNRSMTYHGTNDETSIIDYFIDDAYGATTIQFEGSKYNTPTGLGYYNYLIGPADLLDPTFPDDEYFSDVTTIPDQREDIQTEGITNQWNFSYGANFKDIVFLGAGIGVSSLHYKSHKVYTETFDDPYLNDLRLDELLDSKGTGVNVTLGLIVRPVNFVQVGASFTSPTYYNFVETYSADMNTSWKSFDYYGDGSKILNNESASTDLVTSDYGLTTPMKFSTGIAFISKYGLITGDVEFTNPAKAKYSSNTAGVSFTQENDDIRAVYKSVVNYRIGGEFRYQVFRVRAGYGIQASTYEASFDLDNSIKTISGGLGVRLKRFFVDFALVQRSGKNLYQPYAFYNYDLPNPTVSLKNKTTSGMLTLGFTF
ncbi:MAG: hypothetical protein OEV24_17640 [Cyclobacteriaceae bacterium]|nr:hypothetical protein [Cyclobacteriaceae bacterium]